MTLFDYDELEDAEEAAIAGAAHVATPAPARGAAAKPAADAVTVAPAGTKTGAGAAVPPPPNYGAPGAPAAAAGQGGGLTLAWAGKWRHSAGFYEVIKVDRDLRYRERHPTLGILRGVLRAGDGWHVASLSSGGQVRLRCGADGRSLVSSMREASGDWSPDAVARFVDPHMIEPEQPVPADLVQAVRVNCGYNWTPNSSGPPHTIAVEKQEDKESGAVRSAEAKAEWRLLPNPVSRLAACHCPPYGKRLSFLRQSLANCVKEMRPKDAPIVYASLGSGGLWFDWWMLEGLVARGFKVSSAHFIDIVYSDDDIRTAGEASSQLPIAQMAAWLAGVGIDAYAYYDMAYFLRSASAGSVDVLVQCDADIQGVDVAPAMRTSGRAVHCFLQQDSALQMVSVLQSGGVWEVVFQDASECNGDKGIRRSDRQ